MIKSLRFIFEAFTIFQLDISCAQEYNGITNRVFICSMECLVAKVFPGGSENFIVLAKKQRK